MSRSNKTLCFFFANLSPTRASLSMTCSGGKNAMSLQNAIILCCGLVVLPTFVTAQESAAAAAGSLGVELNKFEDTGTGGCRAFFLFRNGTGLTFEGFEMSLAIFDRAGVIDRLLSIDAAPLPAARTTLKLFEVPDIACTNIAEVLLHDMPVCRPQNAEGIDCFPLLSLTSKASAALVQ
jgi:hypothetical protein